MSVSGRTSIAPIPAIQLFLERHASPDLWFVNLKQLLGWSLLLIGIFLHSCRSGILAITGLVAALLMNRVFLLNAAFDINYFYNLIAILVALGGQYLVWDIGASRG